MFNVIACVLLFLIAISQAGDVTLIGNTETWHGALGRCLEKNSSLANITDIELDHFCEKSDRLNTRNTYWVGNFYKLSNKISIDGCSYIFYQNAEYGYKSLHNCFELCTRKMKTTGFFAHKAVYGDNCICELHINVWLMKKPTKCAINVPYWWIYKVPTHYMDTSNETCRQISCNETQSKDAILWKNNCGIFFNDNSYLKTPVQPDELPYICESNATNSTKSVNYFRFGVNASVKQDRIEKSTIILKCDAIYCSNYVSFSVIQQNCESITSGFLCIDESNILHESTSSKSSTTNIFSPTISTILYLPNTSVNKHEHKESASYETNISKMTTQTTFQQKPSSVPPQSSPGQNNSQVVITASIRSSAKVISKPKGLHTTPSMNNNVLHTSIYTTSLDEINVAESTTQKSEMVSNGHHGNSKIGLIVGLAVAAVVILVAAVLLVSCRLRHRGPCRKKKFDDDIQIDELNDSNVQDDNSIVSTRNVHNTMYDVHTPNGDNTKFGLLDVSLDNSNNIQNNEYAVVVKNKQSGTNVSKQDCDTNGRNSNDLLENEDDRNNHERPRSCDSSGKIRNNEYAVVVKSTQSVNPAIEKNVAMNAENLDDLTGV